MCFGIFLRKNASILPEITNIEDEEEEREIIITQPYSVNSKYDITKGTIYQRRIERNKNQNTYENISYNVIRIMNNVNI